MTPPDSAQLSTGATTTATKYDYGVAHVSTDSESVHGHDRDEAEARLRYCREQGSACYLVRRPVPEWERVPDGE